MDGVTHDVGKWDLLIAHPPCTHMAIDLLPNLTPEQKEQAKAALMAESATRETVDDDTDEEDNNDE